MPAEKTLSRFKVVVSVDTGKTDGSLTCQTSFKFGIAESAQAGLVDEEVVVDTVGAVVSS